MKPRLQGLRLLRLNARIPPELTMANGLSGSLSAVYKSPTATHELEHKLENPGVAASTEGKVAYLNSLRSSVVQLQAQVNEFLTHKMEEDKALEGESAKSIDDKKEEENYGEEIVEDEG